MRIARDVRVSSYFAELGGKVLEIGGIELSLVVNEYRGLFADCGIRLDTRGLAAQGQVGDLAHVCSLATDLCSGSSGEERFLGRRNRLPHLRAFAFWREAALHHVSVAI